jgi:hypothetical protein
VPPRVNWGDTCHENARLFVYDFWCGITRLRRVHFETFWKHFETFLKHFETFWNILKRFGVMPFSHVPRVSDRWGSPWMREIWRFPRFGSQGRVAGIVTPRTVGGRPLSTFPHGTSSNVGIGEKSIYAYLHNIIKKHIHNKKTAKLDARIIPSARRFCSARGVLAEDDIPSPPTVHLLAFAQDVYVVVVFKHAKLQVYATKTPQLEMSINAHRSPPPALPLDPL